MKPLAFLLTIALFPLLSGQAEAQRSGGGLGLGAPGSPHNFVDNIGEAELPGVGGWNAREELCRVCHVPHDHDRATRYGDVGVLWNHALSSATYTMYTSATIDGTTEPQPTGYSKMCLGCHDGTVAIDSFDKYAGGSFFIDDYNPNFLVPGSNFSGDLGHTHPISIVYDPSLDPNLHPKTNAMGGSGTIEDVLENGELVQCTTCHDVHDQPGESMPGTNLLRVTQHGGSGAPSGLCLTCHIK